jgi:hypothetical protein
MFNKKKKTTQPLLVIRLNGQLRRALEIIWSRSDDGHTHL